MTRRVIGRIVNGEYVRVDEIREDEPGAIRVRYGSERTDYFAGVKPSDLGRLSDVQLYMAAERLFEHRFTGTPAERAYAAEAYNAVKHEARGRRATMRGYDQRTY